MSTYSDHFTVAELACPTSGQITLADGFIDDLEALRRAYGRPMAVTSACRSGEHNEWLQARGYAASPNSLHLIGNAKYDTDTCAVDIKRPAGGDLAQLIEIACPRAGRWAGQDLRPPDRRERYTSLNRTFYTY